MILMQTTIPFLMKRKEAVMVIAATAHPARMRM
jgi:hypothetical protein